MHTHTTQSIYLDHAATTALDPRVLETMLPYLRESYGNASTLYRLGRHAMQAIEDARESVAEILHCHANEVFFTSGGTESDNLAIMGSAFAAANTSKHIITSAIEHHAVLHTCRYLDRFGFHTTYLPVDPYGMVQLETVKSAITEQTALVSIMYANNEVGTIQPIAEIGAYCQEHGIPFHTDAVQAGGSLLLDVEALSVDLLSLSAHKFYGPKGSGILYIRHGTRILPQMQGGSQERGRRAGTENVAGIVGTAAALRLAYAELDRESTRLIRLRDMLIARMVQLPGIQLTGHPTHRLPNSASFVVAGIEGETIVQSLDIENVAVSTGSACTSASHEASHVLTALGLDVQRTHGALRMTLGRENTEEDITRVLALLPNILEQMRTFT